MDERARILIVDDHPLVREGLAARIAAQPDMSVCCEADDVESALECLRKTDADLVIVDLALKDSHGLNLIKRIRSRDSRTKLLVISAYDESLFAERAMRAGAQGYVNKQELQDKVIDAIRTVLNGQLYLSTDLMARLAGQAIGSRKRGKAGVDALSDRELEVFQLIGQGKSAREIAEQLDISVHTIDSHREKIRAKLSLKNGAELMRYAVQWVLESS